MSMQSEFAHVLREQWTPIRLKKKRFGQSKSLDEAQKEEIARLFGASADALSAGKRLLNAQDERVAGVAKVFRETDEGFKRRTRPYPEDGIRLQKRETLVSLLAWLTSQVAQLDQAVAALDDYWGSIVHGERERLGAAFDASDYPASITGAYSISWDFPNFSAPEYLAEVGGAIYEQEQRRIAARFEQAVVLAEEALREEFAGLVAHMAERLAAGQSFDRRQEGMLPRLRGFFEQFRDLSIGSDEALDALVEQAQHVVEGVTFEGLRDNGGLRQAVGVSMESIKVQLDGLMAARPAREITFDE